MTSHDVVGLLRRRFGERQIGHAGTLDPDATGVLVVGVGMATRLLRFVSDSRKRYVGDVVLGTETSTLDAAGEVTAVHDMTGVGVDDARRVVDEHLTGDILQVPPMVSALSVGGRRLHELAREGIEVERAPRPVTVFSFDVAEGSAPGVLHIDVECSSGTYIRSLAADLGRLLGGGAHLRNLRRVAVGAFTIDDAAPPDVSALLPVAAAVRSLARVTVGDDVAALVANGRVLEAWPGDGPWAVFDGTRHLARGRTSRTASARPSRPSCSRHWPPGSVAAVRVVTDLTEAVWPGERSVITIGAYDGVHLGHQAVIRHVRQVAADHAAHSAVLTFDRHPATIVRPESAPQILTDPEQRLELLAQTGIEATIVLTFDQRQSEEPPSEFVERVFVNGLATTAVVVGEDFHFGRNREGNVALLRDLGHRFDFEVVPLELVERDDGVDEPVSSTAIRRALAGGDVDLAATDAGPAVRGARQGRPR